MSEFGKMTPAEIDELSTHMHAFVAELNWFCSVRGAAELMRALKELAQERQPKT